MRLAPAAERLTKLEFEADTDWDTYPASVYTCPSCGERIGFALKDLDRHARREFSNLSESHARAAADLAEGSGREYTSFLDFYCPGCRAPIRIYYRAWAGGRWTRGHDVLFVVEGSAA